MVIGGPVIGSALGLHVVRLILFLAVGLGAIFLARRIDDRWQEADGDQRIARGKLVGTVTVAAVLAALVGAIGLGVLGGLLAAMHKPDVASASTKILTGGNVQLVRDAYLNLALWYQRGSVFEVQASPGFVIKWFFVLDSLLFVPSYAISLTLILRRLGRRLNVLSGPQDGRSQREAAFHNQETLASFAALLVIPLVVFDVVENVLTMAMSGLIERPFGDPDEARRALAGKPSDAMIAWVHRASAIKWALGYLVLALLFVSLVGVFYGHRREIWSCLKSVFRIRAVIGSVLLLALLLNAPIQVPDVFRSWDAGHAAIAVVVSIVVGLFAYAFARRVMTVARAGTPLAERPLLLAGVVALVVGLVSRWIGWGLPGLIVLGLILLALSLLGWRVPKDIVIGSPGEPGVGREVLPRLMGVAPVAILGIAAFKALFADTVYLRAAADWGLGVGVLLGWGLLPMTLAVAGYLALRGYEERRSQDGARHPGRELAVTIAAVTAVGLSGLVWLQIVRNVWKTAEFLGAVALVEIFILLLVAGLGLLSTWVERTPPPRAIAGLGLRRMPVFLLALLWLVFADRIGGATYHDVRIEPGAVDASRTALLPLSPHEAFVAWSNRQTPLGTDAAKRRVIPMVFIATAGGGIKAATWTTFVLDCVLHGGPGVDKEPSRSTCPRYDPDRTDRLSSVFAESGISGGSVGLVEYVTHQIATKGATDPGWIRRVLARDFVSPNLAWQMFVETPRALLRYDIGMDRAEVLERAWEHAWLPPAPARLRDLVSADAGATGPLAEGFIAQRLDHPDLPLLVLNGTTVEAGCRFVTSPIRTAGDLSGLDCSHFGELTQTPDAALPATMGEFFAASQDLRQFLCTRDGRMDDVRLSTAAMLSARFPYVSPSGRLVLCGSGPETSVHVVDGGYLDGSGGASVREMWDVVASDVNEYNTSPNAKTCVVPYLIQIDSGYESTVPPGSARVPEPKVPTTTEQRGRGERSVEGRNAAALAFRQNLAGTAKSDRYAILYLRAHPGSQAPLGWTLSRTSVDKLERQLDSNADQLKEIASWFGAGNTCDAP